MKPIDKQILRERLGLRVTFDAAIRSAYDYDLGEMPSILLSLFKTVPDAVVVASSAEETASTLSAAADAGIPVTPRGQATSGYGGAITTRGGIVLDLSEMNEIISVDSENGTVDVEPGVVWGELSRYLKHYGLDTRICPTSAPSSTVGGWFAMGGAGIGSMEYGSIADVVVEIDVAGLDGRIKTLTGEEMELHHQTCGILGVLTRLRVLCKPVTNDSVYAVIMPDAETMGRFVTAARKRLSPNTIMAHSPGYRRLRAEAEGHTEPDAGFLAVVSIKEGGAKEADVIDFVKKNNGHVLSAEESAAEWDARFYPMRIKKLGPSLVVSEFVVPEEHFAACWNAIEKDLSRDVLGLEACVVRDGRIVMLVYLLDNAASLLYPLRMAKAARPVEIARRRGGGFYATGLWLSFAAPEVLGPDKLRAVRAMKRRIDPRNLLNPGKVLGTHRGVFPYVDVSRLLNVSARMISPFTRHLAYNQKNTATPLGSGLVSPAKDKAGKHGIQLSADLNWAVKTCARCGFCKVACCTHSHGGGYESFSPRDKVRYLKLLAEGKAELTPEWVDRLYRCTSCERCQQTCQCSIPLVELWEAARAATVDQDLGPMPAHKMLRSHAEACNNPYNEPPEERAQWMLPHHSPSDKADILVFAGCTAAYRMPKMLQIGTTILQHQNIPYMYAGGKEHCCASPFLRTGLNSLAKKLISHNIDLFHDQGVKRIITPCGGCSKTLKKDYPEWAEALGKRWDFKVQHFSELYVDLLDSGELELKNTIVETVTYHDPCHVGRSQKLFDGPRAILEAIPGLTLVEMDYNREEARCCGAGGGVKAGFPDMAMAIARKRVEEASETGAKILATMCPFCQMSFSGALEELDSPMRLAGIEELLLESLGG